MPDSDIPDLVGLTLEDLLGLDDTVVARGLKRILREADSAQDAVAGFQSSI